MQVEAVRLIGLLNYIVTGFLVNHNIATFSVHIINFIVNVKHYVTMLDPKKKAYSWWIRLDASPTNIL